MRTIFFCLVGIYCLSVCMSDLYALHIDIRIVRESMPVNTRGIGVLIFPLTKLLLMNPHYGMAN